MIGLAASGRRGAPAPVRRRATVGVVIACYNYAHYLTECVTSVLDQDDVDVRVLVMDDASPDATPVVAAGLARRDPRVEVQRNEENSGYIPTFNRGFVTIMERHDPDFIVKLDADDAVPHGAFARAVALMQAEPGVGFVYGRPRHAAGGDAPLPRQSGAATSWTVWEGEDWLRERCRLGHGCISNPEVVMRASAFREAGPFLDASLPHTCDFQLWLRLAAVCDVGHVEGCFQGVYRVHDQSMMRTVNAGPVRDLRGRLSAFETMAVDPALQRVAGAGDGGLRAMAVRRIAREAVDAACRAYERGRGRVPRSRSCCPSPTTRGRRGGRRTSDVGGGAGSGSARASCPSARWPPAWSCAGHGRS